MKDHADDWLKEYEPNEDIEELKEEILSLKDYISSLENRFDSLERFVYARLE